MSVELRVLDLFSGIGGFSLGLERAGMRTVAFCEIEPYARRVLRRHWPAVPLFEDVRTLTKRRLHKEGIEPNVICGGFPCQDISTAGKGRGLDGERSGLWRECARLVKELRPEYAIFENVAVLRRKGLDRVLGDLAAVGYDTEWHCVPASHVGAPHRRDRIWIVAHPMRRGAAFRSRAMAGTTRPESGGWYSAALHAGRCRPDEGRHPWSPESRPVGVADGVPHRVDRLRCLGNAVVPQVVELIGRAVLAHHHAASSRPATVPA